VAKKTKAPVRTGPHNFRPPGKGAKPVPPLEVEPLKPMEEPVAEKSLPALPVKPVEALAPVAPLTEPVPVPSPETLPPAEGKKPGPLPAPSPKAQTSNRKGKEEEDPRPKNISESLDLQDWLWHLGLILFALGLETLGVVWFEDQTIPFAGLAGIHGLVISLLCLIVWWLHKVQYDVKFLMFLTLMVIGLGPFGAFCNLVAFLSFSRLILVKHSFAEWFGSLFPEPEDDDVQDLFHRILSGQDDFSQKQSMMSFQDVFVVGTMPQKRLALTKIAKHFRKEFAPALKLALTDESNAIRVQAATVAARIEQGFVARLVELTKAHKEDPQNAPLLLELARQADNYAYSGILVESRYDDMLLLAVDYYKKYVELRPQDYKVQFTLGRMCLQADQPALARDLIYRCLTEGSMDWQNIRLWYVQALFQLGAYQEVHDYLGQLSKTAASDTRDTEAISQILELWRTGIEPSLLSLRQT